MDYSDYKRDIKRTESKVLEEYKVLYRDILKLFEKITLLGKLPSSSEESYDYYKLISNNADMDRLKSLLLALNYVQDPYNEKNVMELQKNISSKYGEQFKR